MQPPQPLWPSDGPSDQNAGSGARQGVGAQVADSSWPRHQRLDGSLSSSNPSSNLSNSSPGAYTGANPGVDALADRATALLQRLIEVERALTVQEWWMLGKAFPEALILSELTSLLAVARGELEAFLTGPCHRLVPARDTTDIGDQSEQMRTHMSNPSWVRANQQQAQELLAMMATSIPPMMQYARALRGNAERIGMPSAALDPLDIVLERLNEAMELLQQPPR